MEEVEKLARQYIKACFWYYVMSEPIMTDRVADILFKELEKLEEEQGTTNPLSPTRRIYGDLLEQYPDWASVDNDINNLNNPEDAALYGVAHPAEEVFETEQQENLDWKYTFKYGHDQIWNNPILDRKGEPVLWHKRARILCGKKIRVFTVYQEKWVEKNNGFPVRVNKDETS